MTSPVIPKMIRKINRRHFTLFEILVCFIILGIISGIALSWGNSLFQHHQFRHSVQRLSSRLALYKEISVCYQTDVEVVLKKKGDSVELSCTILDRVQPCLEALLYKKKSYYGIKKMFLDDQELKDICIQFSSNICLQERLTLYSTKNEEIHINIRNLLLSTS